MTKKTHAIITIALSSVLLIFMAYFLYDTHQRAQRIDATIRMHLGP